MDDVSTLSRFKLQILRLKNNAGIADVLDLLNHQITQAKKNQLGFKEPFDDNGNKLHWEQYDK